MSGATTMTVLHVRGHGPEEVEPALEAIFAAEQRPRALRLEGTYGAVLARLTDPELAADYRYLVLRPHPASAWTPVLELGNRTIGLDVELSKALSGCDVFTAFAYDDDLSGYLCVRAGEEVDRYTSDPTYFAAADEPQDGSDGPAQVPDHGDIERERGHPERFADLLPEGTAPEAFAAVVLRPGWWEEHDGGAEERRAGSASQSPDDVPVDEMDRMRCIGLALELWGPAEYPFAQPAEEIPNAIAGPAIALAYT
jgi:hypothetical protein